jgi:hypothetical protein
MLGAEGRMVQGSDPMEINLAQQPREFRWGGISFLTNQAIILKMAYEVAVKIKDLPVADGRDLPAICFAENLVVDDPSHALS